jgi:hypothetical protein
MRGSILSAGGKSEETPLLTFFKDANSPVLMKADWQIVQYLLGELLKTSEKQLDGIYNLPSGASFYVPYQAWKMDTETRQAGAAGETTLDSSNFDLSADMFKGDTKIFGVYVDKFGNFVQNLANNLTPEQKSQLNKVAGEIKFGAKYGDWSGTQGLLPNGAGQSKWEGTPGYKPYYPSGEPKTGTYEPTPTTETSIGQKIMEWLTTALGWATGVTGVGASDLPVDSSSHWNATTGARELEAKPINTNFTLNLNSQTQLIVDGRVLADVIKPYLESDQLSSEGSMNSTVSLTVV